MSKTDNLNADYVRRILKTLDDDLAVLVVASCVSLDPNMLLKILVVTADVSYYRNMVKDMEKSDKDNSIDLSADEIKALLETDGWKV
jgi:translation elongation factor EF-Tu-like GTPase